MLPRYASNTIVLTAAFATALWACSRPVEYVEPAVFIAPAPNAPVRAGGTFRIVWDTPLDAESWRVYLNRSATKEEPTELSVTPFQESPRRWFADWRVPADLPAGSGYYLWVEPQGITGEGTTPNTYYFPSAYSPAFQIIR